MLLEAICLLRVIFLVLNTALLYLLAFRKQVSEEAHGAMMVEKGKSLKENQWICTPKRPSAGCALYVAPIRGERYHMRKDCSQLVSSARDVREFFPCKWCVLQGRGDYVG